MEVRIDGFIASLGFDGADAVRARGTLEDAGLTNPRKQNIAAAKVDAAREVLRAAFQRLCSGCASERARDNRLVAHVEGAHCERCRGSINRRAVDDMVSACREAGMRRAVFVGGSPAFRRELDRLVGGRLELRLVDGTRRVTKATALQDIGWADLVVVCGATELAHRVSDLYTRNSPAGKQRILTARRGIAAIARDVAGSDAVSQRCGRASAPAPRTR